MRITLVRHGETDFNYENKIQGLSNAYLNETGRRQCRKLKEKIKDKHYDICFMSPLLRTVETAIILIGERVETFPDMRLVERNMGELEGKDRSLYDAKKYWDYEANNGDLGIEKVQDVFNRCKDFLRYVKKNYDGKDILIVTHGAPCRAFHHILNKKDLNGNLLDIQIPNCYFEEIEVDL